MWIAFLRRCATVMGSAMILMFFSEYFFLNEGPVESLINGLSNPIALSLMLAEFTLYYGLFAFIFLWVISYFDVKTKLDLFLAGAIFGWATEAIIVPIAYEAVPISIVFPSISWHSLIDVMLGWYGVRYIMRLNRAPLTAMMFIGLGVIWAFWATWFWVDTSPTALMPVLPNDFMPYTLVTSLIWLLGMFILDYFGGDDFQPTRWEVGLILTFAIVLFIALAIQFLPFSLALPPIIALTVFALHRSKALNHRQDALQTLHTRPKYRWHYLLGLLTPLTAMLIYPIVYENRLAVPTEDSIFLLLVVGFLTFIVAVVRPIMRRPTTNV